eukprot:1183291-Prorocentrum_minimum.AAC.1
MRSPSATLPARCPPPPLPTAVSRAALGRARPSHTACAFVISPLFRHCFVTVSVLQSKTSLEGVYMYTIIPADNMTSFYGSSCARYDGKDALSTPETLFLPYPPIYMPIGDSALFASVVHLFDAAAPNNNNK